MKLAESLYYTNVVFKIEGDTQRDHKECTSKIKDGTYKYTLARPLLESNKDGWC